MVGCWRAGDVSVHTKVEPVPACSGGIEKGFGACPGFGTCQSQGESIGT